MWVAVAALHRCRWAEVVARLCRRLTAAAAQFASTRLAGVLRAVVVPRDGVAPAATRALADCLSTAVDCASPNELCHALALLHALQEEAHDRSKPDLIAESAPHVEQLVALRRRCEGALVRASSHALSAPAFKELPPELRRRLRDLMRRYVDSAPNLFSSQLRGPRATSRSTRADGGAEPPDIERVRASFVPYAQRPRSRQLSEPAAPPPPQRPTATMPPRVRTTKAQEERAKFNMTKSTVAKTQDKPNGKSLKGRVAYGNAKPRYLEPRPCGKETVAGGGTRKPLCKLVSSSESSRNSSPVLARAVPRPLTADHSADTLSDSLNANKYATYTKIKHVDTLAPCQYTLCV